MNAAGYGTCAAALAKSIVYYCNSSCFTDSVVIYLFFLIGNSTIWTHICTLRASIAKKLIRVSGTWIGCQLVLCKKADCLYCCCTSLCYCFRNVLRSLAYTRKENTSCRRLYRTKLCVCFCKEIVGINACGKHGCNRFRCNPS